MGKFHYRLPPCPSYDMVGMECWLEENAEKGLLLDKEGYVFGFFQFQKGTPQRLKYRLEANVKQSALDFGPPEDPDPEALALNTEFGWEYLGQFKDYYIYRSADPNARELNTDPVVQAMALEAVRKRTGFFLTFLALILGGILLGFLGTPDLTARNLRHEEIEAQTRYVLLAFCILFGSAYLLRKKTTGKTSGILSKTAVLLLFIGTIFSSYRSANSLTPLLDILNRGWLWYLTFAGYAVSCLVLGLISYLHIIRLQQQLRRGHMPQRGNQKKRGRTLRMFPSILPFVLLLLLPFASSYGGRPSTSIPIAEYSQALPFPTIASLAPERTYTPVNRNANNTVRCWSDILSPVNYDWYENAWLDAPDGSRYGGKLSVTYHEAASEAIARRLIVEYAGSNEPDASLIPEGIDASDFDYLAIFSGVHPAILIRKGNIVVCAYCSVQSWGEHENIYPVWLEQMAQLLQNPRNIV